MGRRSLARPVGIPVAVVAYAALAFWLAGSGTGDVLTPLGRATTTAVPLAAGLLLTYAGDAPPKALVIIAAPLLIAMAGALGVTLGWLPLAYVGFAGVSILVSVLAGALVGVLIGDVETRRVLALVGTLAPVLVAHYDAPITDTSAAVAVSSSVDVNAPAIEAWEEVIGADAVRGDSGDTPLVRDRMPALVSIGAREPRVGSLRQLAYGDGTRTDERIVALEDAERLEVTTVAPGSEVPTGRAAWNAGWGGDVVPVSATYELGADGDTSAALTLRGTWRVAHHPRAYPPAWVARTAQARNSAITTAIRERVEARVRAREPRLTAEMRLLRAQLASEIASPASLKAEPGRGVQLLVNGERAVERVGEVGYPDASAEVVDAGMRAALRRASARARTTAWGMREGAAVRLEFEDYRGRCVAERTRIHSSVAGGFEPPPHRTACEPDAMRERARRSRLLAQLPLSAGDPSDHWSVVLVARGIARVYLDSVVLRADTLLLRADAADTAHVHVDSIVAGLSNPSGQSWYLGLRGSGRALDRTFASGQTWSAPRARFTIAADSSVDLARVWPTFEVVLAVPKTAENTIGRAWTYAHAPKAFFAGLRR